MTLHLKPATELARRVLLPDDPHRALAVAQHLLDGPKMFNHQRGLWGYTGIAADGEPLTVQATGIGGPSAAIVTEELISLGARELVRIGTCIALADDLEPGDLVTARAVLSADGASSALGANGALRSDPGLLERLIAAGARPATVVSTDLFYDPRDDQAEAWRERGASVVEMEAAAVLQVAALRGVAAGCVLAVTGGGARGAHAEQMERIGLRLGEAGYAALAATTP